MIRLSPPLDELQIERLGLHNPLCMDKQWLKADIKAIAGLVTTKLPLDTTIGIHGTSLHAIRAMLDRGILPSGAVRGDFTEGCIYFEPQLDAIKKLKLPHATLLKFTRLVEEYKGYSDNITGINARKHALLYFLELDFTQKENHDLVLAISEGDSSPKERQDAMKALIAKGIGEDSIKIASIFSKKFNGILIGLRPSVLREFKLQSNRNTMEAPRIVAPRGLEDRYISGVVPLGNLEREFFRRLQRQ